MVRSCAYSSSSITLFHNRGRRPDHTTRTPIASSSSRRRWMTSRLNPIRNRTSSGERAQFSVEKAYAEMYFTPISIPPLITSSRLASPALCPVATCNLWATPPPNTLRMQPLTHHHPHTPPHPERNPTPCPADRS
ncbi:hypothetical protein GCM10009742_22910 [Kribbella karoonensis]|uniref:Uncharacterized protein n=1 Tax=Kribbella karoonensis TaxID=324851 RepID=A0ABN2DL67_9ACTN